MKVLIIGNSKRLDTLYENLRLKGFETEHIKSYENLPDKIGHDLLILPVPTHNRMGLLNIENNKYMTADDLLEKVNSNALIIGCNYKNEKFNCIDINRRDDFAILNAVPTAEGAIHAAVSNCKFSLFESKILITGFGRVAKILADRLKGLKCDVTVAARSITDISFCKALGFKTADINCIEKYINNFDIIFQTVPPLILTKQVLDTMSSKNTIIELSSGSAGTDFEYASKKGIKVIHAPALPERIAPITAGNILTECVMSIISEKMTLG